MVSRCSHRISPAAQSDIRPRKASLSRQHSSLPCRPLSSEPRPWSPNSAWHQSSQWFTSHSDQEVGSEQEQEEEHQWNCPEQGLHFLTCDPSSHTRQEVMLDYFLGETSKTGFNRLTEDLLTGGSQRRDLQRVQFWDKRNRSGIGQFVVWTFMLSKPERLHDDFIQENRSTNFNPQSTTVW